MSSVDVIVPCYRYGHYLRECVESVLSQGGAGLRVLIIDDASPDDTWDVARALAGGDARVHLIRHARNRGHIATYNEGLDWASATYLMLLSADDYLLPGALTRATAILDLHPEAGLAFGNVLEALEDGTSRERRALGNRYPPGAGVRILSGKEFIEASDATNIVPTPSALVRTRLQKQLGGYRPELPHAGDMEMWWRIAAHASVACVDAFQAVYRIHESNMSRSYTTGLSDLRQRKAALDFFFHQTAVDLPWAASIRFSVLDALGRECLSHASRAFNDQDFSASREFSDFALALCPELRRSWPWTKLLFKRSIGSRAWRALQGARALRPILQRGEANEHRDS